MTITIIGGTGPQGKGLAKRLALSGHNIIIGSRDKERAEEISDELNQLLPDKFKNIRGFFPKSRDETSKVIKNVYSEKVPAIICMKREK